jgi:chromosome segregation ATPase
LDSMSDYLNSFDGSIARLDNALARIDTVIDSVSKKLQATRQESHNLGEERDRAQAELAALRERYDQLQAKANHAADRIEVLIGIVERNFPELINAGAESDPEGGQAYNYGNPEMTPVNHGY